MGEPKPLASLSSALLARKGSARPAMRRQPLGSGPAPVGGGGYDDLGWNDMGYDVDPQQSAEPTRMVDLKPLLTGSLPAHNIEAEHAVDESLGYEMPEVPDAANESHFAVDAEDGMFDPGATAFEPECANEPEALEVPEIVRQQESLVGRVAAAVARKVEQRPAPVARKPRTLRAREKAAFTLRLDSERHLRLRLASAVTNRSAQIILTDLLDDYLSSLPEIDAMASRLPAARPTRQTMQPK